MAVYRAQIGFPLDSALPKDVITINPHYSGDDAQGLANALKANLIAFAQVGAAKPFTIKVYDAQKAPPSYPLATASNGTGFATSNLPRELALCLSYYTSFNRPRYRGRLYIPAYLVAGAPGLRPTAGDRTNVMAWKTPLATGLPAQTVWTVYSDVEKKSQGAVTTIWCDDEWDIIRSRGLTATTRTTASVP